MKNDKWVIRWRDYLYESYMQGSIIEFTPEHTVKFQNRLMAPGVLIHKWYSKTVFQSSRVEPSLPLIDGESAYEISTNIEYGINEKATNMLRINFYGRYDEVVGSIIVREPKMIFKPPITTYSYTIELINGGVESFEFKSLVLREVSREEFNEDQERNKQIKKNLKKRKKRRKQDKKSV